MSEVTTLSRLKNYFIGWHTANYETLHLLTDIITEEMPFGDYAIRSKAIKRMKDGIDAEFDNFWDIIGRARCLGPVNNGTVPSFNQLNDIWTHICKLWQNIGDIDEVNTVVGKSLPIWNHIRNLWDKTDEIDQDIDNLQNQIKLANQVLIIDTYKHNTCSSHHIGFYRKGPFVYVRGWIYIKCNGDVYDDEGGETANLIFVISASTDKNKDAANSNWGAVCPTSSVYLNFNTRWSNTEKHDHFIPGRHTEDGGYHEHGGGTNKDKTTDKGGTHHHWIYGDNIGVDKSYWRTNDQPSAGINSIQLNVGSKLQHDDAPPAGTQKMFTLVVSGHNLKNRAIWFTGTYLARYREKIYGDGTVTRYYRDDNHPDITLDAGNTSKSFPDVGSIEHW